MPYVFPEWDREFPEDFDWENDEIPAPKLSEFKYHSAEEVGGKAKVSLPDPSASTGNSGPFGFIARVFGKQPSQAGLEDFETQLAAIFLPAIRSLGVVKIYCPYDGGNDEGFCWFGHAETQTGEKLLQADIVKKLQSDAGFVAQVEALSSDRTHFPPDINSSVEYELPNYFATLLLGRGYGTGEYSMFGGLIVDLNDNSINDDPNAKAGAAENIEIDLES